MLHHVKKYWFMVSGLIIIAIVILIKVINESNVPAKQYGSIVGGIIILILLAVLLAGKYWLKIAKWAAIILLFTFAVILLSPYPIKDIPGKLAAVEWKKPFVALRDWWNTPRPQPTTDRSVDDGGYSYSPRLPRSPEVTIAEARYAIIPPGENQWGVMPNDTSFTGVNYELPPSVLTGRHTMKVRFKLEDGSYYPNAEGGDAFWKDGVEHHPSFVSHAVVKNLRWQQFEFRVVPDPGTSTRVKCNFFR